jgi:hypothetical protein
MDKKDMTLPILANWYPNLALEQKISLRLTLSKKDMRRVLLSVIRKGR